MSEKLKNITFKHFKLKDIFSFKRGFSLDDITLCDHGIAYVTAKKNNNGVTGYINPSLLSQNQISQNGIVINNTGEGGVCYSFYHPYLFTWSNNCTLLQPLDITLDEPIALFLCASLDKLRSKYSYGRILSDKRLEKESISLPATPSGEIDWDIIKLISSQIFSSLALSPLIEKNLSAPQKISSADWKRFIIKDIFNFKRGKRLTKSAQIPGTIPYISSTAENNGLDNYIKPPTENWPTFTNVLGLNNSGSVGYCFYHPYTCILSDHVTALWLKDRPLTPNIALFLCTTLEHLKPKFSFGREISNKRLATETILLPCTPDGNIDFEEIENIVNLLKFSSNL